METLFRVIKGNWETKETIYLSKAKTFHECVIDEKPLVQTLAERGSGRTELVKIYEDKGEDFNYMDCGGWFIYTHNEF